MKETLMALFTRIAFPARTRQFLRPMKIPCSWRRALIFCRTSKSLSTFLEFHQQQRKSTGPLHLPWRAVKNFPPHLLLAKKLMSLHHKVQRAKLALSPHHSAAYRPLCAVATIILWKLWFERAKLDTFFLAAPTMRMTCGWNCKPTTKTDKYFSGAAKFRTT